MNRLKELRLNANLTQTELATAAETTQRNISYWESGRIELNLYAALRLAQILQVTVEYLAGYSDEFDIKPELNSITQTIYNLNSQENELIKIFRELSPYLKSVALDTVRAMAGKPGGNSLQNKA